MYFTYLFSSQIGILSKLCVLQVFHFATLPRLGATSLTPVLKNGP